MTSSSRDAPLFILSVVLAALALSPGVLAREPMADPLLDEHIVEIMKEADEAEIDAAKLARKRSENPAVKDFANHIIDEHKKNLKEGKVLAKSARIDSKDSGQADALEDDAEAKRDTLKKLRGQQFDTAYLSQQVTMHEMLKNDLETKYIPAAKNPDLKAYLEKTKTHVEAHLDRARKILDQQPGTR